MTTHRQRLAWLMDDEGESVAQRIQAEVQEIYDVLRHRHPDAPQFELWNEALSLHRVRYERETGATEPDDAR